MCDGQNVGVLDIDFRIFGERGAPCLNQRAINIDQVKLHETSADRFIQ